MFKIIKTQTIVINFNTANEYNFQFKFIQTDF